MTWIGPRVTMTMGEDMSLLRMFARKSKRGVPAVAIIFPAPGLEPAAV
jgi:APA family basic amino acid/polyamine antiporter